MILRYFSPKYSKTCQKIGCTWQVQPPAIMFRGRSDFVLRRVTCYFRLYNSLELVCTLYIRFDQYGFLDGRAQFEKMRFSSFWWSIMIISLSRQACANASVRRVVHSAVRVESSAYDTIDWWYTLFLLFISLISLVSSLSDLLSLIRVQSASPWCTTWIYRSWCGLWQVYVHQLWLDLYELAFMSFKVRQCGLCSALFPLDLTIRMSIPWWHRYR